MTRIGVDTGGTFTDAVTTDGKGGWQVHKLPTTAERPSQAVLEAVEVLAGESEDAVAGGPVSAVDLAHGTTHATNALLTGRLGKVVFVTTAGFADVLAIGRQDRDEVYALEPTATRPQQPRRRIVEVQERHAADGKVVQRLGQLEIRRVVASVEKAKPEAVAVALLHAYRAPEHERRLGKALAKLGVPVMLSHEVAPEIREYERAATTWADAALAPVVRKALLQLQNGLTAVRPDSKLRIMRSDGGTAEAAAAVEHPVALALSGPAGGLSAALSLARCRGDLQLMTLDMGGTSTDVAWLDSTLPEDRPVSVGRLPLLARGLPIHSVGTGGGSLADVDLGGWMRVGPDSAGAVPGPACYGRGGTRATVTDAHLHLGRLRPDAFLGGAFTLDSEASTRALTGLGKSLRLDADRTARQLLQVASADMERALRRVSLAEGRDPRDARLYSFGGAGGLHAAWLAERLQMRGVVVPPLAGAFSAFGLLGAPARRRITRSVLLPLPNAKERQAMFAPWVARLREELVEEGQVASKLKVKRILELRGDGQAGVLRLEEGPRVLQRFHEKHQQRFGFTRPDAQVELHAITVQVDGPSATTFTKQRIRKQEAQAWGQAKVWFGTGDAVRQAKLYRREDLKPGAHLSGPAIITEYSATTVVPPRWHAHLDAFGALILEPQP
ncbi:MAG: hydantoinase/oxoprolinase family protein [Planctomycetota bacterium]